MEQGVQHGMAQGNLFFPHRQPILRQKDAEDPLDLTMGLLLQVYVHIGTFSLVRWRQTDAAQFSLRRTDLPSTTTI